MENFLRLREIGADQNLRIAQTTRLYHDLGRPELGVIHKDHKSAVNALEFDNTNARYLLSAGADTSVRLYDLETTEPVVKSLQDIPQRKLHNYGISAIHWYPFDEGLFTTSSYDHYIKVWDTAGWQEACRFDLGSKTYSHSISKIATHSLIASACDNPAIRLCDLRSGSYSHLMRGHTGKVMTVEWSPRDEHILVSGGSDGTVRIWDIRRASACIALLDQYNSRPAIRPKVPKAHTDTVNGLSWSSDGLTLVSTGHDNKIRTWDMESGQNLLINYGTAINNSHWQVVKPLVIDQDVEDALVFYPSDEGQILRYGLFSGYLWKRQFVLNGRVTCVVDRPEHTEIYSGDSAGQIIRWASVQSTQEDEEAAAGFSDNALDRIAREMTTTTVTYR